MRVEYTTRMSTIQSKFELWIHMYVATVSFTGVLTTRSLQSGLRSENCSGRVKQQTSKADVNLDQNVFSNELVAHLCPPELNETAAAPTKCACV